MRFRAKVFLSVLVPAALLVGAAVTVAIVGMSQAAEETARAELERTRTALTSVLSDQIAALRKLSPPFESARINAAVKAAVQSGQLDKLREHVTEEFGTIGVDYIPDLLEVWDLDGRNLLRRAPKHPCPPGCVHAMPQWIDEREGAFTVFHGEPYIAYRFELEVGTFIFGNHLRTFLERICKDFAIEMVLLHEGAIVFKSSIGWNAKAHWKPGSTTIRADSIRYLQEEVRPENMILDQLLLFSSMERVDRQVGRTLFVGIAGLVAAVLVAGIVSARVAHGISTPVETLVEATHTVGEGDFSIQVDIPGSDEMARLGTAFNEMTEGLRKRRDIMDRTLTRDVARHAMKGMKLGGIRRQVTTLFMDVRGFTSATEGVDPAEVVATLNDMLHGQAAAIDRHGGNVNKYLGDGLMAMFGAPEPIENDARACVLAAREMVRSVAAWNRKREDEGKPTLQIGIGIHTGVVLGGWVGHESRLEYTLIGEAVNLSARVCGKAKPGQILITKQTHDLMGDGIEVKELDPVQVKGISYPVHIYEVTA